MLPGDYSMITILFSSPTSISNQSTGIVNPNYIKNEDLVHCKYCLLSRLIMQRYLEKGLLAYTSNTVHVEIGY